MSWVRRVRNVKVVRRRRECRAVEIGAEHAPPLLLGRNALRTGARRFRANIDNVRALFFEFESARVRIESAGLFPLLTVPSTLCASCGTHCQGRQRRQMVQIVCLSLSDS